MKTSLILSTGLLALASLSAAQKVTIKSTPKVGDTAKYKFEMKVNVQNMDVVVTGTQTRKIEKVEGDDIVWTSTTESMKAEIAGAEQEIPATPSKVSEKIFGDVSKVEGGVDQLDEVRSYLMVRFVAPAGEIGEGETYKVDFKAIKNGQPAHTYTGKYVGKEKLNGVDALKFTGTYAEPGKDSFGSKNTFWVTENGTILKVVATFTNFDIPPAGGPIPGTVTLTLVK